MAYDKDLAERMRAAIPDHDGVTERAMFGGLAFLLNGNMAVSASSKGGLMLRVDPTETDALVAEDGVAHFEMRGRPMNGWVRVDPSALSSDEQLQHWVDVGLTYAGSLRPK
jgi:TfoX/Sxy family transcriptional regulator of competence genes